MYLFLRSLLLAVALQQHLRLWNKRDPAVLSVVQMEPAGRALQHEELPLW